MGRLFSFATAFVYRRAVGDGSDSNPLGDAVPNPGATRACAFGLAINEEGQIVLVHRRTHLPPHSFTAEP
jgi:hypothetical protein